MPRSWTDLLDAMEHELRRVSSELELSPVHVQPLHDLLAEDRPEEPMPALLRARAEALHADMLVLESAIERNMIEVAARTLTTQPTPTPLFIDQRF
jgi:hypothetical protein